MGTLQIFSEKSQISPSVNSEWPEGSELLKINMEIIVDVPHIFLGLLMNSGVKRGEAFALIFERREM